MMRPLHDQDLGIGPGRELIERLVGSELSQAHAHSQAAKGKILGDPLEPSSDVGEPGPTQSTDELVAAIAHDRIEGAQVRA